MCCWYSSDGENTGWICLMCFMANNQRYNYTRRQKMTEYFVHYVFFYLYGCWLLIAAASFLHVSYLLFYNPEMEKMLKRQFEDMDIVNIHLYYILHT